MAIRVVCGSCGSKIDAKDELRGQTRRCPKCRQPILIEPAATSPAPAAAQASRPQPVKTAQASASAPAAAPASAPKPAAQGLKTRRLRQDDLYVVVGTNGVVAYWKAGEGWMLNVGNGYSQVKRALSSIPDLGEFVFVEGRVAQTDNGRRLKGLRFWELSGRGVLLALGRSETEILEKAQFSKVPSGSQKRFTLEHIRKHYFRDFTDDALDVVEFLTNFDAHSHTVGTFDD